MGFKKSVRALQLLSIYTYSITSFSVYTDIFYRNLFMEMWISIVNGIYIHIVIYLLNTEYLLMH